MTGPNNQDYPYDFSIRNVTGYEDMYMVTTEGRVFSKTRYKKYGKNGETRFMQGRWLTPWNTGCYLQVRFPDRDYSVHRLVASAFIPNYENKPQVNHINGNKLDNRVENLEWVTNSENQKHAVRTGLRSLPSGDNAMRAIITYDIAGKIRKDYIRGKVTQAEVGAKYGVSQDTVSLVVNNKRWVSVMDPNNPEDGRDYSPDEAWEEEL